MQSNVVGAIDIGGTKIAVGAVDEHGRVLAREEAPTGTGWPYEEGIRSAVAMLRKVAADANVTLAGVGIGSTGPVNPITGHFENIDFLPLWRDKNVAGDLARATGLTVALENDADASALAEYAWGAGRNAQSLVYITVGTGIGGGTIVNGKLYRGVDGSHPEVGHHIVDPNGPACSCGFHGCWESIATGPAMSAWYASQPNGSNISAREIYERAASNQPLALACIDRENRYLAYGLANIVNFFSPQVIVLGGSVMKGAGNYLTEIRRILETGCAFVPVQKTKLALASLGEDANLIGAARVWHHRFQEAAHG